MNQEQESVVSEITPVLPVKFKTYFCEEGGDLLYVIESHNLNILIVVYEDCVTTGPMEYFTKEQFKEKFGRDFDEDVK